MTSQKITRASRKVNSIFKKIKKVYTQWPTIDTDNYLKKKR